MVEAHHFVIPIPRNPTLLGEDTSLHGVPTTEDTPRILPILAVAILRERRNTKEKKHHMHGAPTTEETPIRIAHSGKWDTHRVTSRFVGICGWRNRMGF